MDSWSQDSPPWELVAISGRLIIPKNKLTFKNESQSGFLKDLSES